MQRTDHTLHKGPTIVRDRFGGLTFSKRGGRFTLWWAFPIGGDLTIHITRGGHMFCWEHTIFRRWLERLYLPSRGMWESRFWSKYLSVIFWICDFERVIVLVFFVLCRFFDVFFWYTAIVDNTMHYFSYLKIFQPPPPPKFNTTKDLNKTDTQNEIL